jgi:hypothetical protein
MGASIGSIRTPADAAEFLVNGVTAGVKQTVDALDRGDAFGAGEGVGYTIGQTALIAEGVQGASVSPAPALATSTGAVVRAGVATAQLTPNAAGAANILMAGAVNRNGGGTQEDLARGRASEERVLKERGLRKNTEPVTTEEGTSIPDALTEAASIEIKDTKRVSLTRQLRIQVNAAARVGRAQTVITGAKTKVAKTLERGGITIERDPTLGPR